MSAKIRGDGSAAVSMPLKLLVVVVAVGFIVPAVYSGMSVHYKSQTTNDLLDGLNDLIGAIRYVYGQGTLESKEVTLDFSKSRFSSIEQIRIGDRIGEHPGANQSIISYKLKNEAWKHMVITDPNIPVTSPDNLALVLEGHGRFDLVVQKNTIGFTDFVVAREKTKEGMVKMPDLYVGSVSVMSNPETDAITLGDDVWEANKVPGGTLLNRTLPPGYSVSAVIKNIGNLATDDTSAGWNDGFGRDDGRVRVRFTDFIVERNETRSIGNVIELEGGIGPGEGVMVNATDTWWVYDYRHGDWGADKTLLNRKIIAEVDFAYRNRTTGEIYERSTEVTVMDLSSGSGLERTDVLSGDNIDEIDGDNNNRAYAHIEVPPSINGVSAMYDDPEPGFGSYINDVECNNLFSINTTDDNGFVFRAFIWHNGASYSADYVLCDLPSATLSDRTGDFFRTYIDMGEIYATSNITMIVVDNSGAFSDPYENTIYMEYPPQWFSNTLEDPAASRGPSETGKKKIFFTPNEAGDDNGGNGDSSSQVNYFTIYLEVPQSLNDGVEKDVPDDIPYIEGQENRQSEKYELELKIPIGADVEFGKEKTLRSKVMGMDVEGRAYVDADVRVGLSDIGVDMTRLFDLLKYGRIILSDWNAYRPLLESELKQVVPNTVSDAKEETAWDRLYNDWAIMKSPRSVDDFKAALEDFRDTLLAHYGSDEKFSEFIDAVDNVCLIVDEYAGVYSDIEGVWKTVMNTAENPSSLLELVTFDAAVGADIYARKNWTIFRATYPVFPPVVTAEVSVAADFAVDAQTQAKLNGSLGGIEFAGVYGNFSTTLGMDLRCAVNVGVDFGVAGGGITGWVSGRPELTLTTGFDYSTAGGFNPYCLGNLKVILEAGLDAYIKFLSWTKRWEFWNDAYTLGNWSFDVFGGTTVVPATPFESPDPNKIVDNNGDVNIPVGPTIDWYNETGTTMEINCEDLNGNNKNPDYQVIARVNGTELPALTSNNKLKVDPRVMYNNSGSAFVFWTETVDNQDLTATSTISLTNFMRDSIIWFAIIDGTAVVRGPEQLYAQIAGTAAIQPEFVMAGDDITLTFIYDTDNDFETTDDQSTMWTIWNGTAWSAPALKVKHTSYHYDSKMVALPDGSVLSTWIRDADENFFTTDDQQIVWSVFNGTNWTDYRYLTNDNLSIESIAMAGNEGNIIVVWHAIDWNYTQYIRYSVWNVAAGSWSAIKSIESTKESIQLPLAEINEHGLAAVIWKMNDLQNRSNANESGIYYSTANLLEGVWTSPRKAGVSNADFLDFQADSSLKNNNEIIYTYSNYTDYSNRSTRETVSILITFRPDLEITSLLADGALNLTAREGDVVHINATIINTGDVTSEDFNIDFYDGDPDLGGTLIESVRIASMGRGEEQDASITWIMTGDFHEIFAIIDYANSVAEITKSNNRRICLVDSPFDVSVDYKNISVSPENPVNDQVVAITAQVNNEGYANLSNVPVDLYDGDPKSGGILFAQKIIADIEMGSSVNVTAFWTASLGEHELFVILNISDWNTANNKAFRRISLKPDIRIFNMRVSKGVIYEGDTAGLSATVENKGRADSENVYVKFYTAKHFVGARFISLAVGEVADVSFSWKAPAGNHQIYAMAFPTDDRAERDESENRDSTNLAVLSSKDLTVDMILAEHDEGTINITVNVSNIGYGNTTGVSVDIHGTFEAGNDTLLATYNITEIEETLTRTIYYDWAAPMGTKTVYAIVDPYNYIDEKDETNNGIRIDVDFGRWDEEAVDGSNGDGGSDTMQTIYTASMLGIVMLALTVIALWMIRKRRDDEGF